MRSRDENKVTTIRQKALGMIVREGFDGLSMQKLAKEAGVSPATIYIYHKDREDLIMQLCREEQKKMALATLQNFDPEAGFEVGLRVQWLNRARYCLENPSGMHFLEQIRFSPFYERSFTDMDDSFLKAMRTFVNNAIARRELVQLPVEVYWSVAFAPLYQLVKYHISGNGSTTGNKFQLTEELLNQTLQLVIKALKP